MLMEGITVADGGLWDRLSSGRGRTQFGSRVRAQYHPLHRGERVGLI